VILLLALPMGEFIREAIFYERKSQQLESAYQVIELGMNKEQVKTLLGEPHSATENELGEVWFWNSRNYQGFLWERAGLATVKGHFDISLLFNEDGRVYRKFGGVN
jgi:outer membrane protein assembly factor BamE (lipoprotein component of BamABCDE complex)